MDELAKTDIGGLNWSADGKFLYFILWWRLKNPNVYRGLLVLKTQYFVADAERVKN